MKYVFIAIMAVIMLIGAYMMVNFPDMTKPPFISGSAIFLTGLYLALQCKVQSKGCKCSKK